MFKSIFFQTALLAAFGLQTLQAAPSAIALQPTQNSKLETQNWHIPVILRAGTSVTLTLNQAVDPTTVSIGNALDFMVRNDVTVNGKVLIATGAPAIGIVRNIEVKGQTIILTIAAEGVQAVDGQTVNLNSIPHVVRMQVAQIGATVSSRVRNDIKING
ncbi:MAG: hypothetical protein ACK4Q5_18235 [Saprospiraceae bacterium]